MSVRPMLSFVVCALLPVAAAAQTPRIRCRSYWRGVTAPADDRVATTDVLEWDMLTSSGSLSRMRAGDSVPHPGSP